MQEMHMVLRAHRIPGQVLRMTIVGSAATTPFGSYIGTTVVGKAADLVLID
jgi:5-methylthioadenosine/S-adenosylhomocysteine deaminase